MVHYGLWSLSIVLSVDWLIVPIVYGAFFSISYSYWFKLSQTCFEYPGKYVCVYACMCTCVCARVYVCVCIMCVCMCLCVCVCVCVYVCEGGGKVMLVRHLCVLRVSFWCLELCVFLFDCLLYAPWVQLRRGAQRPYHYHYYRLWSLLCPDLLYN